MSHDITEAVDWRGKPVDSNPARIWTWNQRGLCRPGHACVNDRYARRIDRFFNWNPALSDSYVEHEHLRFARSQPNTRPCSPAAPS